MVKTQAEVPVPPKSTDGQSIVAPNAQATHRDASNVPYWEPGRKSVRMMGYSLSGGRRHTRALTPTRLCNVNHELKLPAWHKPYAEALLDSDPEISIKLLAATEVAIFERLLELSAIAGASVEIRDIRCAIDVMLDMRSKASSKISTAL
jgi:hypothetical protein